MDIANRATGRRDRWKLMAAAGALAVVATPGAAAAQTAPMAIELPSQPLDEALMALARQSNVDIVAPASLTQGRTAPALRGVMTVDQALARLLEGSGLTVRRNGDRAYTIVRLDAEVDSGIDPRSSESSLVVTGTRIRGAPPAAPVVTVTREEIYNSGFTDLGDVARSIPQNFSGGDNPAAGGGGEALGQQTGDGASSLNLRGLGAGATLTLLDGRRLAYTGAVQGVNLSAIPVAAIERVEVIVDGASALYGSDAVGGVANIILRRDFHGASVTSRLGTATQGGFDRHQLTGAIGQSWASGHAMLAADFNRNSEIRGRHRPSLRNVAPELMLYPAERRWGGLLSGAQDLSSNISADIKILYNKNELTRETTAALDGDVRTSGSIRKSNIESLAISPGIDATLGQWRASAFYSYGRNRSSGLIRFFAGGEEFAQQRAVLVNSLHNAEGMIEGVLTTLPAGGLRLAVGGGYRGVALDRTDQFADIWTRDSHYAFGEVFLPLASPGQQISGLYRLSASGAFRYERYEGFGSVVTPQVGVTYAPTPDFTLSGTWGRSFRAPNLQQQFGQTQTLVVPPSAIGGAGFGPQSTALLISGSNPDLGPERSANWTITAAAHPVGLAGARFEVSYFNVDYADRIISPVVFSSALSDPMYAPFIALDPTLDQIEAAIALSTFGLDSITGRPFDPADVVAIADTRLTNVSRQRASGLDISATYTADMASGARLVAAASATRLRLRQKALESQPSTTITGLIFRPPTWRGRASLTWSADATTISSHVNYISGLDDVRSPTGDRLRPQATVDVSGSQRLSVGAMEDVRVQIAIINLLDKRPQQIFTPNPGIPPIDTVNHSVIGRTVTLSLTANF